MVCCPSRDGWARTRSYGPADLERLRRLDVLKELGLSLDETDRKLASLKKFRKELLLRIDPVEAYAERDERAPRRPRPRETGR